MSNANRGKPVWVKLDKSAIPATKTSVTLGHRSSGIYQTTNGLNFNVRNAYASNVTSNKDFIHDIKSAHFSTGDGRPRSAVATNYHYTSNMHHSFSFKGDASKIAAKLDPGQKDDLRRNHFDVGGSANIAISTVALTFKPLTADQRAESKP